MVIIDLRKQEKLVATVIIEDGKTSLDTFDPAFKQKLEDLFLTPKVIFESGGKTADAGKVIEPGNPEIVEILPVELSILGLDHLIRST